MPAPVPFDDALTRMAFDLSPSGMLALDHTGVIVAVNREAEGLFGWPREALEDFRSRPHAFELLITDDTMPRMTGTRLAREILSLRPDLPVLMVSGAERSDPKTLAAIGVRGMLRKPHTAAELERAIHDVLGTPLPRSYPS